MQEQAAWEAERGTEADPEEFWREILPHLLGGSLGVMAKVTGLSHSYRSLIRRGQYVTHQRHWTALRGLFSSGNLVGSAGSPRIK